MAVPEVAKNLEQVAPKVGEAAVALVPVAPVETINLPKAGEVAVALVPVAPAETINLPRAGETDTLYAVCAHDLSLPGTNQHRNILDSQQLDSPHDDYEIIFSNCRRILGRKTWGRVLAALEKDSNPQVFPDTLLSKETASDVPAYLADLARLEWELNRIKINKAPYQQPPESVTVNPFLTLLPVSWKNLVSLMDKSTEGDLPVPARAHMLIWRHPRTDKLHIREAEEIDLLALKIAIEKIDPRETASIGGIHVGAIHSALDRAIAQGILIAPDSRITRVVPQSKEQSRQN